MADRVSKLLGYFLSTQFFLIRNITVRELGKHWNIQIYPFDQATETPVGNGQLYIPGAVEPMI